MIHKILSLSIHKRWLMMLIVLAIIGFGLWSYQKLPIDAIPDITNVQVQINTSAPGYSPLEVEQLITYPIEIAMAGLPKLSYTRSISRYGLSQVTVVFEEGTDLYFARNLINERIIPIKNNLPLGIEPKMGPISTGLGEIFMYTIEALPDAVKSNGEAYNATDLREIQDWIVRPRLALTPGVAEVNTIGGFDKQYHVTPNLQKMLAFNITLSDISKALRLNNRNQGAGYIEENGQQILIRSPGQLKSIKQIESVVVSTNNGIPIQIKDIAEVAIGKELRTGAATQNGIETVLGTAMMLVGENSLVVANDVSLALANIQKSLPEGIKIGTAYNRMSLVNKAVSTVQNNLLEGAILVIVILFLLLGNIRAAIITAAVIPIIMLATITGMVQMGVSANLMSLGALDFGLLVDGTVIIMENAIRRLAEVQHRHTGQLSKNERFQVVLKATSEVIRPSLFGMLIITVVYIPLFTLTGVEGKMFYPMAITVVIALLIALVLSLTIVPAAVAIFMTGKIHEKESKFILLVKTAYEPLLKIALQFKVVILGLMLLVLSCCIYLATILGSEFVPQLNEGDIALQAIRAPGTSLTQAIKMQETLERIIQTVPQVEKVFARTGTAEVATDPMPPNISDIYIILKPRNSWPNPDQTQAQVVEEIEKKIEHIPGNNYEFTQPIQMRFNELISGVRADLGIEIFGDDLQELLTLATKINRIVTKVNGAEDTRVEQVTDIPVLSVEPKRIAIARYGLKDVNALQDFITTAIGGETTGLIYEGDRRFKLVVRLPNETRTNIDELNSLPVSLPDGRYVPLSEIATLKLTPTPAQISRVNGKRRVVVTSNIRNRDLGTFVAEVKQKIDSEVSLPPGYWIKYGGTFEQLESASQRLMLIVPITLFIILVLLIMAFNSFKDPLIIFTGVPLALIGGVVSLWLRDMPFSISAGVGFIALSGISVLNGLVMITFIRDLWHQTGALQQSIINGALTRLRPVLMTALVAGLGFIPMALNTGIGAEVQKPLATVVIGGIISSTLLTLFILPCLYELMHGRTSSKNDDI
ncbi:CusA/CzcA family heavy metal efflux RND transporter [Francisellaceae bacterium]|nr:CusA/CzcA family heavy metal efflux RND transporter [Francisellaceae bacterium]